MGVLVCLALIFVMVCVFLVEHLQELLLIATCIVAGISSINIIINIFRKDIATILGTLLGTSVIIYMLGFFDTTYIFIALIPYICAMIIHIFQERNDFIGMFDVVCSYIFLGISFLCGMHAWKNDYLYIFPCFISLLIWFIISKIRNKLLYKLYSKSPIILEVAEKAVKLFCADILKSKTVGVYFSSEGIVYDFGHGGMKSILLETQNFKPISANQQQLITKFICKEVIKSVRNCHLNGTEESCLKYKLKICKIDRSSREGYDIIYRVYETAPNIKEKPKDWF